MELELNYDISKLKTRFPKKKHKKYFFFQLAVKRTDCYHNQTYVI